MYRRSTCRILPRTSRRLSTRGSELHHSIQVIIEMVIEHMGVGLRFAPRCLPISAAEHGGIKDEQNSNWPRYDEQCSHDPNLLCRYW